MVKSSENLSQIHKPKRESFITCANSRPDAKILIESKGTLKIKGLNSEEIKIEKVLCAGDLSSNLLSLGRLCDLGYDVLLTADKCYVIRKVRNLKIKPVLSGFRSKIDKLWYFDLSPSTSAQHKRHKPTSLNTGVSYLGRSDGNIQLGRSRDSEPISDSFEENSLAENPPSLDTRKRKHVSEKTLVSDHNYSKTVDLSQELSDIEEDEEVPILDHTYAYSQPKGVDQMSDNEVVKYLDLGANVTIQDLEKLTKFDMNSIRKNLRWLYHICLGHASLNYLRILGKKVDCLKGVNFPDEILDCEACKMAKITRQKHVQIRFRFPAPLNLVHSDLMRPITPLGCIGLCKYVVMFIDDFSRYSHEDATVEALVSMWTKR